MRWPERLRAELVIQKFFFTCLLLVSLADGGFIPSLAQSTIFSEPTKPVPGPEMNYTGIRVRPDSILLLYHHEQTLAIVEVAPNRALLSCELLEVRREEVREFGGRVTSTRREGVHVEDGYSVREPKLRQRTKADEQAALKSLKAAVPTQINIAFTDMISLMAQCQKLDSPLQGRMTPLGRSTQRSGRRPSKRQLTSLFSGVFPGTKWCGAGNIASSYYDLGPEKEVDKCCRSHDLCPVKVAGFRTQYNLTNYTPYTKSHCVCDDIFYDCLKHINNTVSNFLGNIYFNVAPVTCVEDIPQEHPAINVRKRFTIKNKRY